MPPMDRDNTTAREAGIRFAAPLYPGARHCLFCGEIIMGAVFPPVSTGNTWVWRLFAFGTEQSREGLAKNEGTAKGQLLAALVLTLSKAGLTFADPAEGAKSREARDG